MAESSSGLNFAPTSSTTIITTTSITTFSQPLLISTTPVCSYIQSTRTPDLSSLSPIVSPMQTSTQDSYASPSATQDTQDDIECSWQEIKKKGKPKRQRESDKGHSLHTAKKFNPNKPNEGATTSNIYSVLENEDTTEKRQDGHTVKYKPPPIYIQDVVNYPNMLSCLETSLHRDEFYCKTLGNNVRVNTNTPEAYRKLKHLLNQNKIAHHTYQPKEERAYRVVIKHLHQSIPVEEIKEALEIKGFQIRNVSNIRSWQTKQPLPLFFIDQEPNENNKNIYKLTNLLGTKITVEAPRKRKEIPQCMRCQQYGHTKSYCTRPYYCVKCAENHPTSHCQKNPKSPAKCVLCDSAHPANYKGCSVYRNLLNTRNKPVYPTKNQTPQNTPIVPEKPTSKEPDTHKINQDISYAQITKSNTLDNKNEKFLHNFLNKFETMFNQLMNQNSMIINLLSTLIKNNNG